MVGEVLNSSNRSSSVTAMSEANSAATGSAGAAAVVVVDRTVVGTGTSEVEVGVGGTIGSVVVQPAKRNAVANTKGRNFIPAFYSESNP